MLVPHPPVLKKIERISPTVYEAALKCAARAAWLASGDRKVLPPHPRALLGIAFHAVLERARSGAIVGATSEERGRCAEALFDHKMAELFAGTHALLRAKFDGPGRLPFYNLYRARAARIAADLSSARTARTSSPSEVRPQGPGVAVEASLTSRDGRVFGRADVLDAASATVVDYKTGSSEDALEFTESEAR